MSLYDENAEVLRELESQGADLGVSRTIDFSHIFPDRSSARAFAEASARAGFEADVETVDRDDNPWDVTASKTMIPTCENITQAEEQLHTLARMHGGRSDGWGFLEA